MDHTGDKVFFAAEATGLGKSYGKKCIAFDLICLLLIITLSRLRVQGGEREIPNQDIIADRPILSFFCRMNVFLSSVRFFNLHITYSFFITSSELIKLCEGNGWHLI
jgi:hypothetical protein